MAESDDEESRLFIDETLTDVVLWQSSRATNTGNPFELDPIFVFSLQRFRTRASQTELTAETPLVFFRNRSTSCQYEYFQTFHRETNTDERENGDEETIPVVEATSTIQNNVLTSDQHHA